MSSPSSGGGGEKTSSIKGGIASELLSTLLSLLDVAKEGGEWGRAKDIKAEIGNLEPKVAEVATLSFLLNEAAK